MLNIEDVKTRIQIYLKRQAVHPEAHSELSCGLNVQLVPSADALSAMTTVILVQDDHQTTLLGVDNMCRPGFLRPCLGEH